MPNLEHLSIFRLRAGGKDCVVVYGLQQIHDSPTSSRYEYELHWTENGWEHFGGKNAVVYAAPRYADEQIQKFGISMLNALPNSCT